MMSILTNNAKGFHSKNFVSALISLIVRLSLVSSPHAETIHNYICYRDRFLIGLSNGIRTRDLRSHNPAS